MGDASDSYSHSSSVSSYAVLFCLALQKGNAEELAIAAMFHDLGLSDLPPHLQNGRTDKMTEEEFNLYKAHPELSIKALQAKHMAISDKIVSSILQAMSQV